MNEHHETRVSIKENMRPEIRERMSQLCRVHGAHCQFAATGPECRKGLRVSDLSEHIQVPDTTLYKVLGGRSEPSYRLAVKLAWGLGWSLDEFTHKFFSLHPIAEIAQERKIFLAAAEEKLSFFLQNTAA